MTNFIDKETIAPGFRPFITEEGESINTFEELDRPFSSKEVLRETGHHISPHQHNWGQLLYASEGIMQAMAQGCIWVIPPQRAVWIPPNIPHHIKVVKKLRLRNIYLNADFSKGLPTQCQVMQVTPLLRELIAQAITFPPRYDENGEQGRLIRVLVDCLKTAQSSPLQLPVPDHGAILTIADHLKAHPADETTLDEWAQKIGTTSRTLARNFKKQTNMTFGQWRQQARLLEALSRLAENQPISHIAQDLGYSSQSAFSTMFKKALGVTPGQFFKD